MSSWAATRLASSASETVQQPAVGASPRGPAQSFRVTPMTSWPACLIRAAATDESTPPDMATRTLTADHRSRVTMSATTSAASSASSVGGCPSEAEADTLPGLVGAEPHRLEHMGDGGGAGLACRSGRGADPPLVEEHQESLVANPGETHVEVVAGATRGGGIDHHLVERSSAVCSRSVPDLPDLGFEARTIGQGQTHRSRRAHGRGHIMCARATPQFLPTAMDHGSRAVPSRT